ncbi:Hypothetical protein PENO1_027260 [Penicillium occitanis (nom. inval.)]|nr:hypothetical protein PENOC_073460 [Penicillium occitanis (nom. inval.)]PCH04494.1 Hypothetical protein PENO1_027260 [Penicillium occitanis (nom. inval.)]
MLSIKNLLPIFLTCVSAATTACNNSPSLCSKSYGEITHLGAHDSPFLRDASTSYSVSGNQFYNTTVQLSAGVRLLDAGTLESWLSEIKTWLDGNPNDVVTVLLVNSDDATDSELATVFESANITDYAYTPSFTSATTAWPTLQELISNGTRLMTFVASLSSNSNAAYLMDEFTYIWENPYDVTSASNFSCLPERPSSVSGDTASALSSNRLPFMNHFLDTNVGLGIQEPDVNAASTTNGQNGTGNLLTAAETCKSAYSGRQPSFILVDWFNKGPAIDVVDQLNNVTDATGRVAVPNTNADDNNSTSTGTYVGLLELVDEVKNGANPSLGNWIWAGGDWASILGGGVSI